MDKSTTKTNDVDKTFVGVATHVMKMKRRQSRYGKQIGAIWELFSDYSAISTIHGVRYLGEKKRHWSERIFWLIAFLLSIFACGVFICQAWLKWQNSPVIVTFSEESTPVYHIPFPTVTICTDIKIKQRVLNYTDVWHKLNKESIGANITKETAEMTYSLSPLCIRPPLNLEKFLVEKNKTEDLNIDAADLDSQFFDDAQRAAPSLKELFSKCNWHSKDINCSDIFNEILTDEGLCYTFNYLNASEIYREMLIDSSFYVTRHNKTSEYWNTFNRDVNVAEDDIYPYRVLSGSEGLKIDLRLLETDIDYMCSGPVQSFKILLHSAGEIPQLKKYYYRIPLDHDIVMAVRPNIMNTTDSLIANYDKEQRKCVAEGERKLVFFTKYTQRNCQLDNLALRTTRFCKCVLFSMPRLKNVRICRTRKDLTCAKTVEMNLIHQVLHKKAISYNCLPSCRSISYDAELSMAKLDRHSYRRAANLQQSKSQQNRKYTRIFISFKDEQFFSSRRAEMYGKTDFIANCGGIMGLFMGVSILSIVEIIYFSTLRIGCSLRKRQKQKQKRLQQLRELNQSQEKQKNDNELRTADDKDLKTINSKDLNEKETSSSNANPNNNTDRCSTTNSQYDNIPEMRY